MDEMAFDIPNIGVNVAGAIQTATGSLAAIVAVAVASFAAFLIVRRGLRWMGTALR